MSISIRSLFVLSCLLLMSIAAYSAVKTPSEVTFNGEVYKQAFQEGDGIRNNRVTEYLRSRETFDNYVQMIAIWEYPNIRNLEEFAGNLIRDHKKNFPSLGREIIVKNDQSEAVINYVVTAGNITEFDIFRLLKRDGHIIVYQYVSRNYSPTNTSRNTKWRNDLKQNKAKWVEIMTKVDYVK